MRNRYILLCDVPMVVVAACGAFALRFDLFFPRHRPEFLPFLLIVLLVKPAIFLSTGMYGRLWRYASVRDLLAVLLSVTAASAAVSALVAIGAIAGFIGEFSRAVLVIDWLLTLCAAGGVRMAVRLAAEGPSERRKDREPPRPTLIVGAGEAGVLVLREIRRNPQLGMDPVAFLDDDGRKVGKHVHGIPVVGRLGSLSEAIDRFGIAEVVIAIPKAGGTVIRKLNEACREHGIASRILPGVFELLGGRVSVSRLRMVEISDLLRREQVIGDPSTGVYLAGKRVMVTGAGGSIGSELCRQIALSSPELLVLLGHGENSIFDITGQLREHFPSLRVESIIADIRDAARLDACIRHTRPDVVFHAAAHKHVPLMEENPEEAVTNNVLGTRNVLDACTASGVQRLVMISTDKAVSPGNVMGASKRLAEMLVRERARRMGRAFSVVRFGNVLGSRGSVVPLFKKQIERGGPITITHPDVTRFFMTIPEAVHLVLQAGGLADGGELFVLNMGEPVPIVQLAEDLIRLSGIDTEDIHMVFTGLRPGEKLEEQLWEDGALVEPTRHSEVLRVTEPGSPLDVGRMNQSLESLLAAARSGNRVRIEAALADLVPSYVPSSVDKHLSL